MLSIIHAELRRNIKNKKIFMIILIFLCFFTFMYSGCISKGEQDIYEQKLDSIIVGNIVFSRFSELKTEYQNTPADQERKDLKEEYFFWKKVSLSYGTWAEEYYIPDYFGWKNAFIGYRDFSQELYNGMKSKIYKDELLSLDFTKEKMQSNVDYYNYFLEHNISPYRYESIPNLANFIFQITKGESFFFATIIICILLLHQLTHDYEVGTYKLLFSQSTNRNKMMTAKIISTCILAFFSLLIAFLLFSIVPIIQFGVGSFDYIYRIGELDLATYFPTILITLSISVLVLILFVYLTYLLSLIFKQFSNALIALGSILVIVYFLLRLLGNQFIFALFPIFYIYPFDIATSNYPLPMWICILLLMGCIITCIIIANTIIKRMDMKGSDA